jgi:hypothetical protein
MMWQDGQEALCVQNMPRFLCNCFSVGPAAMEETQQEVRIVGEGEGINLLY